jgi:hypothetical protein
MEREEETGKMKVKKADKKDGEMQHARPKEGDMNEHEEGLPTVARHAMERRDMHSRHETEHMIHDHSGKGDKHEMHARHEEEMKTMHKKHEKELKEGRAPAGEKETKPKQKEGGDEAPKKPVDKDEKG